MAVSVDDIEGREPASVPSVSSSYKEICTRTSWVDARTALDHITKGRASGSRGALWFRSHLQDQLQQVGEFCDRHAGKVLFVAVLVLGSFCVGLKSATLVTDIEKLWVQDGGRLQHELSYVEKTLGAGAGSTKQLLIQTAKEGPGVNLLKSSSLLAHLAVLRAATAVTVDMYDTTWELTDICYALAFPEFDTYQVEQIFKRLNPCIIITPLDCFWEGALLLGPKFPVTVPGLGNGIRWSNMNPSKLVEKIELFKDMGKNFPLVSFADFLKRAGISTGYQEKPCLDPLHPDCPATAPNKGSKEPVDVGAEVTGGCYGFAARYMHWPEHLIVGTTTKNKTGHIVRGEALQSVVQLMGSRDLFEYWRDDWRVHNIDWTQERAAAILDAWMAKFMEKVSSETVEKEPLTRPYRLLPFSDATLESLLQRFSELSLRRVGAGYALMLVYAVVVLVRPWSPSHSQAGLGVAAVALVGAAVAAGMGFCALLGLPFSAASTQVLPFLALGLSVDNAFLMLHTAAQSDGVTDRTTQVGSIVKRCGVSILMTSCCTSVGFACAALVPVPALRYMCLQAAILLLVNMAVMLLVFPAFLSLDMRRRNARRADVLCCFPAAPVPLREEKINLSAMTLTTDTTCCLPQTVVQTSSDDVTISVDRKASTPELSSTEQNPVRKVMVPKVDSLVSTFSLAGGSGVRTCIFGACHKLWLGYISCITTNKCRAVGIVLLLASVAASAWGVSRLKDGLSLSALVPRGSSEAEFLEAQQTHFSIYHMFTVTKGHFEYPAYQKILHDYHATFTRVPYILKDDDGGLPDSWLTTFRKWLLELQKSFDRDWQSGRITKEGWHANASDDGVMAYKLLVQTGHVDHPVDRSLVTQTRLVDPEGIINPSAFYNYLSAWVTNDAMAYSACQADLKPEPGEWHHDRYNDYDLRIPKSSPLVYAQMPFYLRHLNDTESVLDMIKQVREICDRFVDLGLPNFPKGVPFTFWEHYINLRFSLIVALLVVVVGVFLVVAVFLMNAWAAALTILLVSLLVFQLAGFMGMAGIHLSAAPAVLLVAAVGIGMQANAVVILGFVTCVGGRRRRAAAALYHMAPPVLQGALSTLLAALMLLFSEFDFIRRCFFYVVAGLVVLCAADGLFFLPIILSLIGPPAELISHAHPDRLPTPTPPPSPHLHQYQQQLQQLGSMGRHCPQYAASSSYSSSAGSAGSRGSSSSALRHMGPKTFNGGCTSVLPSMSCVEPPLRGYSRHHHHHHTPSHDHHHHGGSNHSLSTITEEPRSSHSTNSCQSTYSNHSAHEIVVEPQVVVETTTYGGGRAGGEAMRGDCGGGVGHVTTKVTATAKVKVELHTPLTCSGSALSSNSKSNSNRRSSSSSCRRNRNSTSNNHNINSSSPTVSVHTNNLNSSTTGGSSTRHVNKSDSNHYRNNNSASVVIPGNNNTTTTNNNNNNNRVDNCGGSSTAVSVSDNSDASGSSITSSISSTASTSSGNSCSSSSCRSRDSERSRSCSRGRDTTESTIDAAHS